MKHATRHASRIAHQGSHPGFTLIELLASSVLTVVLLSAVLTVLTSSFSETRRLRAEQSRFPSVWLLREQIHRDVQNAQGMQVRPGVWQLYGYLATDAATRMPTLERALVTYQVRVLRDQTLLVREEQRVDDIVPSPPRREVVWGGAAHLVVTALATLDRDEGGVSDTTAPETGGLPPTPPSLQVVLLSDSNQVLLRETIRHHQEL